MKNFLGLLLVCAVAMVAYAAEEFNEDHPVVREMRELTHAVKRNAQQGALLLRCLAPGKDVEDMMECVEPLTEAATKNKGNINQLVKKICQINPQIITCLQTTLGACNEATLMRVYSYRNMMVNFNRSKRQCKLLEQLEKLGL